jgi:hypothetical protein
MLRKNLKEIINTIVFFFQAMEQVRVRLLIGICSPGCTNSSKKSIVATQILAFLLRNSFA